MRREGEARRPTGHPADLLRDLGLVAVLWHAVRPHALIDGPEEVRVVDVVARPRHARLRVDDEVVLDEVRAERRQEREERRRRVAAGVRDDTRAADLAARELRQAVDRFL